MTQLHTIHHGLGVVRPTNDVDIVLHIETQRGVPNAVAVALEELGYRFQPSIDQRNDTAHRFVRGTSTVDLVVGAGDEDQVDVLIADHPAPRMIEKLRGHEMIRIEGGTQALRSTVNARLGILPDTVTMISVPRPFGALILKAAAYTTDSRDRERHLSTLPRCSPASTTRSPSAPSSLVPIVVASLPSSRISTPPTRPGGHCPRTTASRLN